MFNIIIFRILADRWASLSGGLISCDWDLLHFGLLLGQLGDRDGQHTILDRCRYLVRLDVIGQVEAALTGWNMHAGKQRILLTDDELMI